jgi:hypothetical protein
MASGLLFRTMHIQYHRRRVMDVSIATVKAALHGGRARLCELARGPRDRACM